MAFTGLSVVGAFGVIVFFYIAAIRDVLVMFLAMARFVSDILYSLQHHMTQFVLL